MPASSEVGAIVCRDKRLRLEFRKEAGRHFISCDFKNFWKGKPFYCELSLERPEMGHDGNCRNMAREKDILL